MNSLDPVSATFLCSDKIICESERGFAKKKGVRDKGQKDFGNAKIATILLCGAPRVPRYLAPPISISDLMIGLKPDLEMMASRILLKLASYLLYQIIAN